MKARFEITIRASVDGESLKPEIHRAEFDEPDKWYVIAELCRRLDRVLERQLAGLDNHFGKTQEPK